MPARRTCTFEGCSRQHFSRGFCKLHYDRWARHGDPSVCLKPLAARGAPTQWLRANAQHDGDECLIWPFARFPDGRAHMAGAKPARIMCGLRHGPPPTEEHQAAHSCGMAHIGCVNPKHLRWATPSENSADKIEHGTVITGSRHYNSKLTEADVVVIRSLKGIVKQRELAKFYGVGITCINKILKGRSWGCVQ